MLSVVCVTSSSSLFLDFFRDMSMHIVGDHTRRRVSHWVSHPEFMNCMCCYEIIHVFEMLTTHVIVVGALEQKLTLKYLVLCPKLINDTHKSLCESH
jgi:hypothetical protein